MGDPVQPTAQHTTTIQLSAALAGGAEARGRQLALLQAVVATTEAVLEVRQDGDALRVTFGDARAAALCAVELQQRVEADNRTAAVPGVLRIAAAAEAGRDDRLCALAGAGQILVDATLYERLKDEPDLEVSEPRRLGGPDAASEIRWDPLPEPVVPLPARLEVARPEVFVGRGDYRTDDPKGPKETPKKARFSAEYSSLPQTPFKQEVKPGMPPVTLELKK